MASSGKECMTNYFNPCDDTTNIPGCLTSTQLCSSGLLLLQNPGTSKTVEMAWRNAELTEQLTSSRSTDLVGSLGAQQWHTWHFRMLHVDNGSFGINIADRMQHLTACSYSSWRSTQIWCCGNVFHPCAMLYKLGDAQLKRDGLYCWHIFVLKESQGCGLL